MKVINAFLGLLIITFLLTGNLCAIDIEFKQGEIADAVKYGKKYGDEIFKSPSLKYASISFWPGEGGILVRNKYVDLAVSSAMRSMMKQKVSDKEMKEIIESLYLKVQVRTKDDPVITLKQGNRIIEPDKQEYTDPCCESCKFSGVTRLSMNS